MVVFAGQGDPARSMALLWRLPAGTGTRRAPGPRPGLTVDVIVAAAIAVADAHGTAGLSMRAVAERLGVTAMALYTYVPGKRELLDVMYDAAHAELPAEYDLDQGWRAAVTVWAEDLVAFYVRHPWVLEVSFARPVLGPHEQHVLEVVVGILRGTGLAATVLRRVIGVLFHLTRGSAQAIAEARRAATSGSDSEREWWAHRTAALSEVVPDFARRFPMSTWLASARSVYDPDGTTPYLEAEARQTLTAGLNVLLDGVEAGMATDRG
jgi:AcrR family transcriptional regulator